jgi:hypothetical protein
MAMRLFFILVALIGSGYLLFREKGDRKFAIGALAASALGLMLQLHWISLRVQYARTVIWLVIGVCCALMWNRESSKTGSTVAASVVFVSALTVALSLRLLR